MPIDNPNKIRSVYTFSGGNLVGPGLTEGDAKSSGSVCKSCGESNEWVDYNPDYECKKCKMMNEWAKSAKAERILALANMFKLACDVGEW